MASSRLAMLLVVIAALRPVTAIAVRSQAEMEANPMRKIINMLQAMAKEVEREGEVEKEIFAKALCACEGGETELNKVIDESTAAIDEYTSKIESETAEKAQLTQEVADHKTGAAEAKKDLSEATSLRDKEHKQFVAEEKDTKMNLGSLSKAIPAIEKGMSGAALMQMPHFSRFHRFVEVTKFMSADDRSSVLAFLDQGDEAEAGQETKGAGEILGILKNMKDNMQADLKELQDEEQKALEGFNDMKAAKSEEISVNEKSVVEKEKRMGGLDLSLSEGKHALEDAKEELANAQKFKANMAEQCATIEKDQAMRAKMRAAEVEAISKAVEILNDDDALEVFSKSKKGAAFVQQPQRPTYDALLQVTRSSLRLKSLAKNSKGPSTGDSAEKLVKGMIDGMVGVLHDEDVGDEHKKAWCTNETEVAHGIEATKKDIIEKTSTEISEQEDELTTLNAEIKALGEKIAETDKMVHEATATRKAQHQEFVDAFATSGTAIRLIDKAILQLERFYSPEKVAKKEAEVKAAAMKKAGLSLLHKDAEVRKHSAETQRMANTLLPGGFDDSFLQLEQRSQLHVTASFKLSVRNGVDPIKLPETPKTYEKKESGGVIGLMNDFKTDLKMDMTESETEEKFAAKEYVRIMTDAQETRAQDVKSMNEKKAQKATLDVKLVSNKELLELSEEQLQNLELYLVQIHTECDFLVRNFENRHEGRIEGETGLESAETIVTGEQPPSHKEIEEKYEEEHSAADVDENFPNAFR